MQQQHMYSIALCRQHIRSASKHSAALPACHRSSRFAAICCCATVCQRRCLATPAGWGRRLGLGQPVGALPGCQSHNMLQHRQRQGPQARLPAAARRLPVCAQQQRARRRPEGRRPHGVLLVGPSMGAQEAQQLGLQACHTVRTGEPKMQAWWGPVHRTAQAGGAVPHRRNARQAGAPGEWPPAGPPAAS